LPLLTLLLFGALTLLSLVELRGRRPERRGATIAELSAEALARYESEARQLRALREEARRSLDAADFLELFQAERREADGAEQSLPSRARLLADFQELRRRRPDDVAVLARGLLGLWRQALSETKWTEAELGLLEHLFLHATLALDGSFELDPAQADAALDLAETLSQKRPQGLAALLPFLRHAAGERAAARIESLAKAPLDAQLQVELQRLVRHLRGEDVAEVADVK
jgi:hypothetical protein